MANGSMHSAHLIEETVYGVCPATPAMAAIRHTKFALGVQRETLQSEELRSDRQLAELRTGTNKVGGNIARIAVGRPHVLRLGFEYAKGWRYAQIVLHSTSFRRSRDRQGFPPAFRHGSQQP